MEMERRQASETSAYKIQTPWNYQEQNMKTFIFFVGCSKGIRLKDLWSNDHLPFLEWTFMEDVLWPPVTESYQSSYWVSKCAKNVLLWSHLVGTVNNINRTLYTHLLTPWCRVLLEKLTGLQLVKKFPAFHGTRRSITALTTVHHLSLSWASPIQSIYPHPTYWRSILILSTHLRLGLPSGLLPSGFPSKSRASYRYK